MWYNKNKYYHHCRWCGIPYKSIKPCKQDGFHSKACKQAHYRAYKKYVTGRPRTPEQPAAKRVTRKNR